MLFDAEQLHQSNNSAIAVIVDTHGYDDVFHRCDDDQCPYDQRQHTKHDILGPPAIRSVLSELTQYLPFRATEK